MRSAEVSTAPPEVTAFCRATLSKICCGVMPSVASLAWFSSTKIFCGRSPMISTLFTLGIGLDAVEKGKLLQLLLDLVGDLGLHLGGGRSGPCDVHHHALDGE